jgi:peptidyl-prolyl cis-trans isomerase D
MITWIQRTFQKHTKLVFLFLLFAITIPFVFTIGAAPGIGKAGNKVKEQMFFGVNLGKEDEARRIMTDGNLSAQLKAGYNALEGAQLQQYALQRVAGLAVADELHLPAPTSDQVAKYVLTLRAFLDQAGQFDQKRYTAFGDSLKGGSSITTADVNRVLRDDTRLEQVAKVVGGPGYVLPPDVKQQLIRSDSSWTVQVASLDYAAFNPAISTGDDVLKKFHEENAFRYEVPARPRLSYVEYKAADFMPPNNPTEAELRASYTANAASFPVPAEADKKDALAPATPVDNFPKVRAQVEVAIKNAAAGRLASKAANDLTVALFEQKQAGKLSANSAELTAFLASVRRPAAAIPPFSPDSPPANLAWLGNYAEPISRLSKDRFFSDPLQTPDSFVVLLWNDDLPGYKPAFTEVHDKVATDYKESQKRKLFSERGRALSAQLQAAAKSGATAFAAAAAAEKLDVKSYANFTLREPPKDLPYSALSTLSALAPGAVSDMMSTGEQGLLVYVQDKKLPDLSPSNPRYVELQKQMMLYTAGNNENSYLSGLVENELKKTPPATP